MAMSTRVAIVEKNIPTLIKSQEVEMQVLIDLSKFKEEFRKRNTEKQFSFVFINNVKIISDDMTLFGREIKFTATLTLREQTGTEDFFDIENTHTMYVTFNEKEDDSELEIPDLKVWMPCKLIME